MDRKDIWLIKEENHGVIGAAADRISAIDFLIKKDWLTDCCEYWDSEEHESVPLPEWAYRHGYADWREFLFNEPVTEDHLENLGFYLSRIEVHKAG